MKYSYVIERVLDHYPNLEPSYINAQIQRCSFVSLDRRYMYYQVPKAACSQVKEIMRRIEGTPPIKMFIPGVWVTHRDMFIHGRPNLPLPSLVDLDNKTQREVLESPDFFRMTVVRNPYKRLISAWRNRVFFCEPIGSEVYLELRGALPGIHSKSIVSFEEFIGYLENRCDLRTCNDHWRRQVDHILFPALNFNCIGKVEQFGEVLQRFKQHLELTDPLVANGRNVSFPVGSASYTQEIADTVYGLYRRDFEVLGYDRNSWPKVQDAKGEKKVDIPQEKFYDEIMERNIVILGLYQENERLQTQLNRASRLGLLPIVNGAVACRSAWRRVARALSRPFSEVLRPAGRGKRSSVPSA